MRYTLFFAFLISGLFLFAQELDTDRNMNSERYLTEKYYEIGKELRRVDLKGAEQALQKSRKYALEARLFKEQARAEYMLSECLQDRGDLDSATYYINSALRLVRQHHLPEPYPSMVYGTKGNLFAQTVQYDSAFYYHDKALESLTVTDMEGLAFELMNYASLLYHVGEVKRARSYYDRVLDIALTHEIHEVLPIVLENKIVIEHKTHQGIRQGQLDTLMSIAKNSNEASRLVVLQNVASILIEEDQLERAKPFIEGLKGEDGNFKNDLLGHNLLTYASYLRKLKQYTESMRYLRRLKNDYPQTPSTITVLKHMGELFALMGEPDSSQKYYDLAWELNKAQSSEGLKRYIASSESTLSVLQAQNTLRQSKIEQQLLQVKLARQRWWIAFSVLVVGLMTVVFVQYRKAVFKTRKLKEIELKHRQARIVEMGLKLSQKNELIKELEKQFAQHTEGMVDEFSQWKNQVSQKLRQVANTDKDWENLSQYFEDQYQGFYSALKTKHPELTNNDLRLCTLARMRMSIKEMAGVLNLSLDSVKSNRYRLRKKLGLSKETSLSDYLSGF